MSKKNLVFKKTLVARALTLAFGVGVASFGFTPEVMAQSNAAGTVYGTVATGSATSVVLKNTDTNLTRTVTIDANGKYQATALPAGHYKATLLKDSTVLSTAEFDVLAGQGVEPAFASVTASGTPGVQSVEVSARRSRIDVSSATNGATFTAKELAKLPVAQSVDGIIQLAPNTTRADSRYAGGASFGGGGASENAYYINGFPVTNPLTQLGASELPFGAIGQAQILTGGFGAEFGRSVGGVVNITTKSGTNNWEAGASVSVTPNALRSKPLDIYYPNTGLYPVKIDPVTNKIASGTDGSVYRSRQENTVDSRRYGAYIGGPIVQDKLFMFLSAETTTTNYNTVSALRTTSVNKEGYVPDGFLAQHDETTRYLGKFDWNISDDHRLELTLIGDKPTSDQQLSGYKYITEGANVTGGQRVGPVVSSAHYTNVATYAPSTGADTQILKYTGNLTENLTLTALYGESTTKNINTYDGYDVNQKKYQVVAQEAAKVNGVDYPNPQPLTGNILPAGAEDKVKSTRLDLEYKLGSHTIRAGLDDNKLSSINAGDFRAGGGIYQYLVTKTPTTAISMSGVRRKTADFGGYGVNGYYGRERIFTDVTNAYSDQSAQYIEDRYQVTKDLLVTFGVRNEQFKNKNGDQQTFLEMKNQFAPRLAAAWDVYGDSSTKVFGSAGRYMLQIPTHLAVRGASRSTFTDQYFTYTGVDAMGVPIGRVNMTTPVSTNNEYGQAKDVNTVSALDMKPTYQDEITLGFEKAYSPSMNFGAKVTYRQLKSTIDDFCDQRPFDKWLAKHPEVNADNWGGFGCASFNPGVGNTFLVDFAGTQKNYTKVFLSKEDLGFDSADRKYTAVDLFIEHPYRNGWYGKVNYTWSRSKGNTEGQTKSDNAQTDVAATSTWDTAELMQYSNGVLPNDRTHQIKAYGFYDLTPQWTIGGNFLAASGRPKNCFGNHPNLGDAPDYGSVYFYCDGKPAPRGTNGNLPWDVRLDMNLAYKPQAVKGLTLKVDVFNLFNKQTIQTIDETYNSGTAVSETYGRVISYTAPRSVRLTAEYNHKF